MIDESILKEASIFEASFFDLALSGLCEGNSYLAWGMLSLAGIDHRCDDRDPNCKLLEFLQCVRSINAGLRHVLTEHDILIADLRTAITLLISHRVLQPVAIVTIREVLT